MTFRDSIQTCLRKYFTFSGRASRSEYWWFFLFCILGGLIASSAEAFINGVSGTPQGPTLLSGAFNLVTFIPGLAVGWRRMHDTGRSGLYLFYPAIALVGLLIFVGFVSPGGGTDVDFSSIMETTFGLIIAAALFVVALSPLIVLWWLTRPSEPGQNKYGPNPHEVSP